MTQPELEAMWQGSPRQHEAEVRQQVHALDGFDVLDAISAILAVVIDRAAESRSTGSTETGIRGLAVLYAAMRAFRAVRAATAVIASGYPLEAEPYTRMLLELFVAAKAVIDDQSESEATQWLAGERARGIGRRVREALPDGSVYRHLSQAAHGDPRPIHRALLSAAEGQATVEWGPAVTSQTEEQLSHLALAARDFAVLLEEVGYGRQAELDAVDAAVQRLLPDWRPDAPYGTSEADAGTTL